MSDIINAPSFERRFLPRDLVVNTWDDIAPFIDDLKSRSWSDLGAYRTWIRDWDEVSVVMGEHAARLYIEKSRFSQDKKIQDAFQNWVENVAPHVDLADNELNKRFLASPFNDKITDDGFALLLKRSRAADALFREENIELGTADMLLANEYGEVASAQTITLDGEVMKPSKASPRLEWADRAKREEAWRAIAGAWVADKDKLDDIFDRMVKNRHLMALNAGEKNYRDYKFKELQRFDYTPNDAKKFHDAIEKSVMPLVRDMYKKRAADMGLEKLRPWDLSCDPHGRPAIVAFRDTAELISKSIAMLDGTVKKAADTLRRMQAKGTLDLEARMGKENGGYNIGLPESRVSFMFMNHAGTADDVQTIAHESGHALHDMLAGDLELSDYHSYPMELAEVASMSMELFTHDQWDIFYNDPETCRRAKQDHLNGIIEFLPRMAAIDAFQHGVYENPDMTPAQRHDLWMETNKRFGAGDIIDHSGLDPDVRRASWHRTLHIFEVPFYYIEYGIAQLGALQMWRNYKQNKDMAIAGYEKMLALGYTRSVPDTYAAGGIKFDFSANMIDDLMQFVRKEIDALQP